MVDGVKSCNEDENSKDDQCQREEEISGDMGELRQDLCGKCAMS